MALRSNPDKIRYETRPLYLKHPETGRVYTATDELIERGDLLSCDADGNIKNGEKKAIKGFQLSKATKIQIIQKAKERFGFDMPETGLKEMRATFKELENKHAGDRPNQPTGV